MIDFERKFLDRSIRLSAECLERSLGGPFGAVVVKDGEIVGQGLNKVTMHNDPTAHAEIVAIREACQKLNTFELRDCILYTSTEPCPMCLGAIYWSRIKKVFYANTREDAADAGFDDAYIYNQLEKEHNKKHIPLKHYPDSKAIQILNKWKDLPGKIEY